MTRHEATIAELVRLIEQANPPPDTALRVRILEPDYPDVTLAAVTGITATVGYGEPSYLILNTLEQPADDAEAPHPSSTGQ